MVNSSVAQISTKQSTLPDSVIQSYVQGNYAKALSQLETLAKEGNVVAQANLGVWHAQGIGVARNMQLAKFWIQKAAKSGYDKALANLGTIYLGG